jgi:hypothetical protein
MLRSFLALIAKRLALLNVAKCCASVAFLTDTVHYALQAAFFKRFLKCQLAQLKSVYFGA